MTLCLKDARDLDENDLTRLLDIVQTTTHNHILITHGYQTLANTIKWLEQKREREKERENIIFVDSLTPLSEPESDAPDQLVAAHKALVTSNASPVTIIRKKQRITVDELQQLQYE
ncbi:MAG: asparaginase [Candidatus Peribacteria bacterium]|nr:MAG: asparaginase [Candidatus Peribacteria bacterium]